MLDVIPRIKDFMAAMDRHKEELNKTRLVLTHQDLYFGNIMYDISTKRITAVLDWEYRRRDASAKVGSAASFPMELH